jgi:uncharacterized protein YdiU (UPF0061 family)
MAGTQAGSGPASEAFAFDNSYAAELEGFYVPWQGERAPKPTLVQLNRPLAEELGLDPDALDSEEGAAIFAGSAAPVGATPLAQAYAGHQFGGFVPQLGDGRALLIGEVIDRRGRRRDLHLKGSGRTPFSRGGDGKAVLGPVLREYLVGEAMHALGIPSTRALAAVTTGERIMRRGPEPEPGAVLTRVASSHLRVGTFEFFAARGEEERLAQLLDYALRRHDPDRADSEEPAMELLRAVRDRQASLVAQWMSVGFVHGVMNTDNTTISGETLDYGPCAFMDAYDPGAVFSSIDRQGRYAYGNQPVIAQWNLARLAEALIPLFDSSGPEALVEGLNAEVGAFTRRYQLHFTERMRSKLGLSRTEEGDAGLIEDLLAILQVGRIDFTAFFRRLAEELRSGVGDSAVGDAPSSPVPFRLEPSFRALDGSEAWLARWRHRLAREGRPPLAVADAMDRVNPVYIPRNHNVEAALEAAWREGDYGPFRRLLGALERPFERRPGLEDLESPAPDGFGPYVTFCGT